MAVLTFLGWAYSGGGRWPERVEISADGGYVWYAVPIENLSPKHKFAWRTFKGKVPCDHEGWMELVVRCWDNSLNTQPMEVRHSWNWSLHVTSSCHRVKVYSVNAKREATRKRLMEFNEHGESFTPITRPTGFVPMSIEEYERVTRDAEPRDVDE
jgi:sulfite oxidase